MSLKLFFTDDLLISSVVSNFTADDLVMPVHQQPLCWTYFPIILRLHHLESFSSMLGIFCCWLDYTFLFGFYVVTVWYFVNFAHSFLNIYFKSKPHMGNQSHFSGIIEEDFFYESHSNIGLFLPYKIVVTEYPVPINFSSGCHLMG